MEPAPVSSGDSLPTKSHNTGSPSNVAYNLDEWMMLSITMNTTAVTADRVKRRERERKARQRRESRLEEMRKTLTALERAVLVSHTLGGDDAVWEDFLDVNSIHVRRTLRLVGEASALQRERAQLERLLEEHHLAVRVLAQMIQSESPADEWDVKVKRWRELTRQHYKPWTLEACQSEMDAALKEINTFQWSLDKQTSGLSFLGWRELRRVDTKRGVFQFQFYKTYRGYDLMDSVNVSWDTYTDVRTFEEVIMGHRARGAHEILQQLRPNVIIFRTVQQFTAADVDAHIVDIISRVKTDRGFTQCVRSLVCPELIKAIDGPSDMWASNFIWRRWEELPGDEHGYKLRIGGTILGADSTYLNQWMMEVFGYILRSERLATKRQLIVSE